MKKLIFLFGLFIAFQAVAQEGIRFLALQLGRSQGYGEKREKTDFYRFLYPMVRPLPEYG